MPERQLNMLVLPTSTILHAMRILEDAGKEIVLVCDGDRRLLGTVTDGDIRRAVLAGRSVESTAVMEIMQAAFTAVSVEVGRAEVLDMMRARGIGQVPIVDANGRLQGLHTLHALLGAARRPNSAVIMAGGKGTRLRPYTEQLPKPMVRVAGRPILERILLHLVGSGIRTVYLAINYLGHIVEQHFGDGDRFGCHISYLRETKPLGTGGALSLLPPIHDPIVVMNGDLVTQADVGRLLDFHTENKFSATMGVRTHTVELPFGVADVVDSKLVSIREKPFEQHLVNSGIYVLSPDVIRIVPPETEYPVTELFRTCIERGIPLGAHVMEDDWLDVARPEELMIANGRV